MVPTAQQPIGYDRINRSSTGRSYECVSSLYFKKNCRDLRVWATWPPATWSWKLNHRDVPRQCGCRTLRTPEPLLLPPHDLQFAQWPPRLLRIASRSCDEDGSLRANSLLGQGGQRPTLAPLGREKVLARGRRSVTQHRQAGKRPFCLLPGPGRGRNRADDAHREWEGYAKTRRKGLEGRERDRSEI